MKPKKQIAAEYLSKYGERNERFRDPSYKISAKPLDTEIYVHSSVSDKTSDIASEREGLRRILAIADRVADAVDPFISPWIVYSSTVMDEQKYEYLTAQGMPKVGAERFFRDLIEFHAQLSEALDNSWIYSTLYI